MQKLIILLTGKNPINVQYLNSIRQHIHKHILMWSCTTIMNASKQKTQARLARICKHPHNAHTLSDKFVLSLQFQHGLWKL